MPRIKNTPPPPAPLGLATRLGTMMPRSAPVSRPPSSRSSALKAWMEIGVLCKFVSRRCAVTTISSSCAKALKGTSAAETAIPNALKRGMEIAMMSPDDSVLPEAQLASQHARILWRPAQVDSKRLLPSQLLRTRTPRGKCNKEGQRATALRAMSAPCSGLLEIAAGVLEVALLGRVR
jgi:hypothetical protein